MRLPRSEMRLRIAEEPLPLGLELLGLQPRRVGRSALEALAHGQRAA